MIFRKLKANEIDCRVAQINEKGLSLLLYKDARVDMRILDETVGAQNWQRKHELINGNLFCSVGIHCVREIDGEYGEWIWKQDVGTESYTEKEKGQASDAFKRACFNWGIGRELYSAPFIWITADKYRAYTKNNKPTTYDKFIVSEIGYDDNGDICNLCIVNTSTGNVVYRYKRTITDAEYDGLIDELMVAKVSEADLCARLKVRNLRDLLPEQLIKAYGLIGEIADETKRNERPINR